MLILNVFNQWTIKALCWKAQSSHSLSMLLEGKTGRMNSTWNMLLASSNNKNRKRLGWIEKGIYYKDTGLLLRFKEKLKNWTEREKPWYVTAGICVARPWQAALPDHCWINQLPLTAFVVSSGQVPERTFLISLALVMYLLLSKGEQASDRT